MLFQTSAQIAKIQTMADRGNRVVIDTQELSPEDMATLFSLKQGGMGWFLFKGSAITTEEIPDYDPATFDEIKSPSQRLRAVLFVYWKEIRKGQGDFEGFYRAQVERIIEQYKEKLPA
jgi:hypothetical protein